MESFLQLHFAPYISYENIHKSLQQNNKECFAHRNWTARKKFHASTRFCLKSARGCAKKFILIAPGPIREKNTMLIRSFPRDLLRGLRETLPTHLVDDFFHIFDQTFNKISKQNNGECFAPHRFYIKFWWKIPQHNYKEEFESYTINSRNSQNKYKILCRCAYTTHKVLRKYIFF